MKKAFLFSLGFVMTLSLFIVSCNNGDEDGYTPPASPYVAVDLGLPSGLKWASCNVGATVPEGYGGYFAWGETEEKAIYDWEYYKYSGDTPSSMKKYCLSTSYGTPDGKDVLDMEDDVAYVKWGGNWRMPTHEEQAELVENCDWEWTTLNDVYGYVVKSRVNDNSIFLPATGYRSDVECYMVGRSTFYWSRDLRGGIDRQAYVLYIYSGYPSTENVYGNRATGYPVRPVCK